MFELKPLSKDAIPAALGKAERYRLLNEPAEAESICLDVLDVDPANQPALVMLLLALTDQFEGPAPDIRRRASELLPRLASDYERAYYDGIIRERRAKALIHQQRSGYGAMAYEWLSQAMACYEKAEKLRPAANDDALLRWNACARVLEGNPHIKKREEDAYEPMMLE
jgi:hypothetical protein